MHVCVCVRVHVCVGVNVCVCVLPRHLMGTNSKAVFVLMGAPGDS